MGESHVFNLVGFHHSLLFRVHFHIRKWKGAQISGFGVAFLQRVVIEVSGADVSRFSENITLCAHPSAACL